MTDKSPEAGWDDGKKPAPPSPPSPSAAGDSAPPPKKSGVPLWGILLMVGSVLVVLGVICIGVVAAVAIPSFLASKSAAYEASAMTNLKVLNSAQAQYFAQANSYAPSGAKLAADHELIQPSLAAAFELNQQNGDAAQATPRNGYLYRMLLGEGANPRSYIAATSPTGEIALTSWAATSRPAERGSSGQHQFYIGEAGVVYKQADPGTGTFILNAAPADSQSAGWVLVH